jgi:hypothetical protein
MTGDLGGRDFSRPLFRLGRIYGTNGATEVMDRLKIQAIELLRRHQRGDYGDLGREDKASNDWALEHGGRIFSAYGRGDNRLYVITEADRSMTTILTPGEY